MAHSDPCGEGGEGRGVDSPRQPNLVKKYPLPLNLSSPLGSPTTHPHLGSHSLSHHYLSESLSWSWLGGGGRMERVKEKREEEEVVNGGMRVRVLVVDDSPVDRRIVEALLKRTEGVFFEVITVDSGKKAMEVLGLNKEKVDSPTINDQKIDIILTDYCMPEMTGYDLLKAVKEHSCKKSIPVVLMSSENEPQRISRCRALGAEDFILKPLQTKDVIRLRNYARPTVPTPKIGSKRKMPLDLIAESSGSERRPRLAGVAVA